MKFTTTANITKNMSKIWAIDVWMQHPTKRFLTDPMFESLNRWNGVDMKIYEDDEFFGYNPETSVGMMDAGRVEKGFLSAWYAPSGPLITNKDVDDVVSKFPDRFYGIAAADIRNPVKAVEEITYYVKERGFKGVRIMPWLWEKNPDHPLFYPIYTACVQMSVPLCLQVGHTGPMFPSEHGRPIPYLERVCLDFPDLTIVGGHIGAPWTEDMMFLCTKFPNVYIDTSAYKPTRYPKELVEFMKGRGRKRVLFGTNYPMIPHPDITQQLDDDILGLDEKTKFDFLRGNAERVFKLGQISKI